MSSSSVSPPLESFVDFCATSGLKSDEEASLVAYLLKTIAHQFKRFGRDGKSDEKQCDAPNNDGKTCAKVLTDTDNKCGGFCSACFTSFLDDLRTDPKSGVVFWAYMNRYDTDAAERQRTAELAKVASAETAMLAACEEAAATPPPPFDTGVSAASSDVLCPHCGISHTY